MFQSWYNLKESMKRAVDPFIEVESESKILYFNGLSHVSYVPCAVVLVALVTICLNSLAIVAFLALSSASSGTINRNRVVLHVCLDVGCCVCHYVWHGPTRQCAEPKTLFRSF